MFMLCCFQAVVVFINFAGCSSMLIYSKPCHAKDLREYKEKLDLKILPLKLKVF